jgi:hypothetical protein
MDFYKLITEKGFGKQKLIDGEEVLAELDNPVTSVEDDVFRNAKKELKQKPLFVGYDNAVVLVPNQGERFPLVSLAHYFLVETLSKNKQITTEGNLSKGRVFADLGCGAGFLGNYISKNFPVIMPHGKIIFGDLFPESINAAINAYAINHNFDFNKVIQVQTAYGAQFMGKSGETLDFRIGDVRNTMLGEQIDVAVACPIYIPEICEVFPQAYEIFGAVAKSAGADFYFAHTSLSDKVVEAAAKKTGAKLVDINSQKFPFVIHTVDSSRDITGLQSVNLEKLTSLGLMLNKDKNEFLTRENFAFHYLRVSKFSYK